MGLIKDIRDIQPNNPFNITKEDLYGEIKDFPLGVVVKMLEEQENQGNKPDIKIFQNLVIEYRGRGGFNWGDTKDGHYFWSSIIAQNHYDKFYDKYPEYKQYDY